MSEAKYNTNLAAEFHVLSALHRLGVDATLTLGNKKSVDIVVVQATGRSITVDVKGLAGKTSWPVDNHGEPNKAHFYVFVCFGGKIADPTVQPEVWIVPSLSLKPLIYHAPGGRQVVQRSVMQKAGAKFKDAWHLIAGKPKQ